MTSPQPTAKYLKDYQPPDFHIETIDLDIALDDHQTRVLAISQIVRNGDHARPLVLDGEALELLALKINGDSPADYQLTDGQLCIAVDLERFELEVETRIDPANNSALEGLYKSGNAFCTQCEAEGFRRITYYLDRPDVLARFTTRISAPKEAYPYLLANGNKVASGDDGNGRHWVTWQDPFPKPAYLFALVAGDFDLLQDRFVTRSGRQVDLELFVDKGNLPRAGHAMASLKRAMRWDEQRFDLEYDLDIYMIVAVDFFNMGAMENKGLNIFNSKYVLANTETATDSDFLGIEAVIGHEYFHNWTGNRVTCRDWFQLSLKEGLTVFRDQEFSSDVGSRAVNRINNVRVIRGPQFAEDASPMAHPIRPEAVIEMNNFYTVTVYNKGAEVIRMMHTLLGEEQFQQGMALYFKRHDGQAVTCEDFVAAMEDASGIDLGQFRLWYSQSGTPQLTVSDEFDAGQGTYTLKVIQHTPATADQPDKQPLHIPLDIELLDDAGQVLPLVMGGQTVSNVLNVTEAEQHFVFEGISAAPTPSLLREFSAPVKLKYPYQDEQLMRLMVHASNAFSRWDAAQMLIEKYVIDNVERYRDGRDMLLPMEVLSAFRGLLLDKQLDPALVAEAVTLPSEMELAELFDVVDVDAIGEVRDFIIEQFAHEMVDEWLAIYRSHSQISDAFDHQLIGRRKLKNVALGYIAELGFHKQVNQQFASSTNMTDTLAALAAANRAGLPCRDELMAQFDTRWRHDGLVMDKWFALQASQPLDSLVDRLQGLLAHPTFDPGNPNRIRALIGTFVSANPRRFHATDGSGYRFLCDILIRLNKSNPQVASRLITPLLPWRRYDEGRAALMKETLSRLQALPELAPDLYEKVSKALDTSQT